MARIQAEDFNLVSGFYNQIVNTADQNELIRLGRNETGVASLDLDQAGIAAGFHDLAVTFFDENDGISTIDVQINDVSIGTITLDQDGGRNAAQTQNLRTVTFDNVVVPAGATLKLVGNANSGEFVRIDYVEFTAAEPVPGQPAAVDDVASTDEDSAVTIDVLANDSDPEGDVLSVTSASAASGSVVINADNSVTYTPDANFSGVDTLTYAISDGNGGVDVGEVTVTVAPINDAPVANDDVASIISNTSTTIAVLANDGDVDGDPLNVTSASAANGVVTVNGDQTLTYLPDLDFIGTDTITYTVDDGNGESDSASVIVTVSEAPIEPVRIQAEDFTLDSQFYIQSANAADQNQLIRLGRNETGTALLDLGQAGIAAGPHDLAVTFFDENDGISTIDLQINDVSIGIITLDQDGGRNAAQAQNLRTVTFADVDIPTGATLKLVGNSNSGEFVRIDYVEFTAKTSHQSTPTAENDAYSTDEDVTLNVAAAGVLGNDADPDGDTLSAILVDDVTNGILSLNADGSFAYSPNANFNGTDSFTYRANDGTDDSGLATVTITINPVNDAPTASGTTIAVAQDVPLSANLPTATDIDGDTVTYAPGTTTPANGMVAIQADGSYTYAPNASFNGADAFSYTVDDGNGGTNEYTVTINVGAPNDPPVAMNDAYSTDEDVTLNVAAAGVLGNDADPDGDTLSAILVDDVTNGTLSLNADGSFAYSPNANFNGTDSFTYRANDGTDDSGLATVTITINPVNDAPTASGTTIAVAQDAPLSANLPTATDIDGDTVTYAPGTTTPANGVVAIQADGSYTYTPNASFNGADAFSYTVDDGNGGTNEYTVTVNVGAPNDPPVAMNDTASTSEDAAVSVNVLENDTDINNDTLSINSVGAAANGTTEISNGEIFYTPNADFNGTDTFAYTVGDGHGGTATATVTVTVAAVNDAPTFAVGDGYTRTDFGYGDDRSRGIAIQSDGRILAAGYASNGTDSDFAVVRYNTDGSVDTNFGVGGRAFGPVGPGDDQAYDIALQPDGKIVLTGFSFNGTDNDVALARFTSDGQLDTSFGDGDGSVTTPVGPMTDLGRSVAVQANGTILVAGYGAIPGGSDDFYLLRYTADGQLDTTFGGGDGIVTTAVSSKFDHARNLTVQPDGKILIAGYSFNGTDEDFALVRYLPNGDLDTTFGANGIVTTNVGGQLDKGLGVAIQADGKILITGHIETPNHPGGIRDDIALVRYTADGQLDTTFGGGDGIVVTQIGTSDDIGYSVIVQPDGKILVAGYTLIGGNNDFALVRYLSNGDLDTTFGGGAGFVVTDVGPGNDFGRSLELQSDGKIVVAGYAKGSPNDDIVVIRYDADGTIDTTFGFDHTVDGSVAFVEDSGAVVLDRTVKVFDAEFNVSGSYDGAVLSLSRAGGANGEDQFSQSGDLATMIEGANLVYDGKTVGTVTKNSSGLLILTFGILATQAVVNNVMSSIAYANTSDAPPASVAIAWSFSDGNDGAEGTGGALVATGTTQVRITAINDAPVSSGVVDLTPTTADAGTENTNFVFTATELLANTSDPDNDPLSVQNVSIAATFAGSGVLSDDGNGTYTFAPTANFAADDVTLQFDVTDGNGGTIQASATFDILATAGQSLSFAGLADSGSLSDQASLSGNGAGQIFTTDAATLDLTGVSASSIHFASSNAGGTTFTVDRSETAFSVVGGPGNDILDAETLTFTQAERDSIFSGSQLEVIKDTTGIYGNNIANTLTADTTGSLLSGAGGEDILIGDTGVDTMTGGADNDTFVMAPGGNADTITDFNTGAGSDDVIDLTAFDAAAAQAAVDDATQVGNDTLIDLGNGDTITLINVDETTLNGDDFLIA